jgi:hypothetical protein
MKNLKYVIFIFLVLNLKAISQEVKDKKENLYILFDDNERNKFIENDSTVLRTFYLDFGKFSDKTGKLIKLKVDENNNLEINTWIRGENGSGPPIIMFYFLTYDKKNIKREKIDLKTLKKILEEDEIIKYVEFNNLKEILTKFDIYAVKKEGEEYFTCKVEYSIQ